MRLPEVVDGGKEAAGSSGEELGRSTIVSSCEALETPFTSCDADAVSVTSVIMLVVVVVGGESGAATISTSSLASRSASGSMFEARRFSGEEALSGNSAAPPMIARW